MITQEDCIAAEKKLAKLLGWTNIQLSSGVLMGSPKERPFTLTFIPQWTREWEACVPLIGEYGLRFQSDEYKVSAYFGNDQECTSAFAFFKLHPTKDDAIMFALVQAMIAKLKAEKEAK